MKYYISDLHLFHNNVISFDNRPFENMQHMLDVIGNNWNSTVTNGDYVYILGDVSMRGNVEELVAYVSKLRGHKVLIKGNHDDVRDYRYEILFDEICEYKEITDKVGKDNYSLVLCHYPIFSWKRMGRGNILLYGHTHNSAEDVYYQKCLNEMADNDCRHIYGTRPTAINVGCMKPYMDYKPRTLEEILAAKKVEE